MNPQDAWRFMENTGQGVKTGRVMCFLDDVTAEIFVDEESDETAHVTHDEFCTRFQHSRFVSFE